MRLPLYGKILCWFFLNLVALAVCTLLFLHFDKGLAEIVMQDAGEQLKLRRKMIADNVRLASREPGSEASQTERDKTLKALESDIGGQLFVMRDNGELMAGEANVIPHAVERLVYNLLPDPPLLRDLLDEADGRASRSPSAPGGKPDHAWTFTDEPRGYWLVCQLPVPIPRSRGLNDRMPRPPRAAESRPGPLTIIAFTPSLFSGGIFLDVKPWILGGTVVIAFSALFWIFPIRSLARSISRMTRTTERLSTGEFDVRVSEKRGDELGQLGDAINRMAVRLDGFVTGQKRFMGDIAHELCAPLSRAQMALGILQQRTNEKDLDYVNDLDEEIQHVSGLVNELLSFSKASLGVAEIKLTPILVRDIADEVVRRERIPGARLVNDVPHDLLLMGEPELLKRALSNLVRNAIRYAGKDGPITVSAAREEERVVVSVCDEGPGVPELDIEKLTDPFYRVDTSRAQTTGGVGLGLAIVKTCMDSCRGAVETRNRKPKGFEARLLLEPID